MRSDRPLIFLWMLQIVCKMGTKNATDQHKEQRMSSEGAFLNCYREDGDYWMIDFYIATGNMALISSETKQ